MALSKHVLIALAFALALPLEGCTGNKKEDAEKADGGDDDEKVGNRRKRFERKRRKGKGKDREARRGKKGRGKGKGKGKGNKNLPLDARLCRTVKCDEGQKQVIAELVAPYTDATAQDRAKLIEHRQRLGDHLRAETLDAAGVQAINAEIDAVQNGIEARAWGVLAKLHPVLTDEQRETIAKRVSERGPVFALEGRQRIKAAGKGGAAPTEDADPEEQDSDEPDADEESNVLAPPDDDAAG